MKILIVEDEVSAREGLAHLLGKIDPNYVVCGKASDGEQGLKLAEETKPDLIFVDIEMPKLNGLEMIEKIQNTGQEPYFVILSGYSDFKYAQKSIRLRVVEYLLKPITYSELKNIMAEISNKFKLKKENNLKNNIPKEEILKAVMLGTGKTSEYSYKIIENSIKENMYVLDLYFGEDNENDVELIITQIFNFMEYYDIKIFFYSVINEYNCIVVFLDSFINFTELVKMLKYNLMFYLRQNNLLDVVISAIRLKELIEMKDCFDKMKTLLKWAMVFGNDEIICDELISKVKVHECDYPKEIENEALQAIKDNEYCKLIYINKKLMTYLKSEIYSPDKIIEICGDYIFAVLSFLKSCNNIFYNELKDLGALDHIKNCYTLKEIENDIDTIIYKINDKCINYGSVKSLPIRKTLNYIKSYYNNRISLEEIARGMNITQEYLSHLFTKEVGKSFSDYLKEYRINEAKKLLVNDKMKIYEVAKKVGYNDAKYFCKTFKSVTGMSPKEYMKFY